MTGRGGGGRRVLVPPIQFIFKLLQQQQRLTIWLYEQLETRIEGNLRGFDEFMNLVITDAVEIKSESAKRPTEERRPLGMMLIKGDNVSLIQKTVV